MTKLSKADFTSDQDVRWCPGCGDYAILASVQKIMPELNVPRENVVFVSGIGCAGRFPYYMNTYGFHTIHGRAPAIASGLKISRPDLSVWVVTGDGDGLSIGGNHLLHILRRNVDVNILLFNNRIYGLTKGQYSPTSELGKVTGTSPFGTSDRPIDPIRLALSANASFVARAVDVDTKHLQELLITAAKHKGTSFIEIYQNCNIFNDGAFAAFADRNVRDDKTVWLEHGKPVIFGKDRDKGIKLNHLSLEICAADDKDILIHDSQSDQPHLANMLACMPSPEFPVPLGIFRQVNVPVYEDIIESKVTESTNKSHDLDELLHGGYTWEVR